MTTGRKTLSIVMATYNGSRYIDQQLQSLSIQTVPPDEIIISDDNSNDNTYEIVKEFKRTSPFPVKTIRRVPGLGFRENFLQTALEARGDFVAFCDQDDVWRKDKIEKCSQYFNDPSISLIVHPATTIDHSSNTIGEFRQNISATTVKPPLAYDLWSTFWGFSIIFRRDLLDIVPIGSRFRDYIDPRHLISHDRWITFIGQIFGATAEIDEYMVAYRQHDTNLFGQGVVSKIQSTYDIKTRTELYIEITLHMLFLIHDMQEKYADKFPLYEKTRCIGFVERALAQLQVRKEIYLEESRLKALQKVYQAISKRSYTRASDDKFRWKSLARDLQFIALRT